MNGSPPRRPLPTLRPPASCSPSSTTSTRDRKSTRLNSSHSQISYAVFCLKKTHEIGTDILILLSTQLFRPILLVLHRHFGGPPTLSVLLGFTRSKVIVIRDPHLLNTDIHI